MGADFIGWDGVFIGLVALAVAVPPLIALIWGQPKIEADFRQTQWGVSCAILNAPLRSKFLQAMGVTRREPEVAIHFYIEDSSGRIIVAPTNPIDPYGAVPGQTTGLRVHEGEQFQIACWRSAGEPKPEVRGDWLDGRYVWNVIEEGTYTAIIRVKDVASNKDRTFKRRFVIGANPIETKWLS